MCCGGSECFQGVQRMPHYGPKMFQYTPSRLLRMSTGFIMRPQVGRTWIRDEQHGSKVDNNGLRNAPDDVKRDLNGFKTNARWLDAGPTWRNISFRWFMMAPRLSEDSMGTMVLWLVGLSITVFKNGIYFSAWYLRYCNVVNFWLTLPFTTLPSTISSPSTTPGSEITCSDGLSLSPSGWLWSW